MSLFDKMNNLDSLTFNDPFYEGLKPILEKNKVKTIKRYNNLDNNYKLRNSRMNIRKDLEVISNSKILPLRYSSILWSSEDIINLFINKVEFKTTNGAFGTLNDTFYMMYNDNRAQHKITKDQVFTSEFKKAFSTNHVLCTKIINTLSSINLGYKPDSHAYSYVTDKKEVYFIKSKFIGFQKSLVKKYIECFKTNDLTKFIESQEFVDYTNIEDMYLSNKLQSQEPTMTKEDKILLKEFNDNFSADYTIVKLKNIKTVKTNLLNLEVVSKDKLDSLKPQLEAIKAKRKDTYKSLNSELFSIKSDVNSNLLALINLLEIGRFPSDSSLYCKLDAIKKIESKEEIESLLRIIKEDELKLEPLLESCTIDDFNKEDLFKAKDELKAKLRTLLTDKINNNKNKIKNFYIYEDLLMNFIPKLVHLVNELKIDKKNILTEKKAKKMLTKKPQFLRNYTISLINDELKNLFPESSYFKFLNEVKKANKEIKNTESEINSLENTLVHIKNALGSIKGRNFIVKHNFTNSMDRDYNNVSLLKKEIRDIIFTKNGYKSDDQTNMAFKALSLFINQNLNEDDFKTILHYSKNRSKVQDVILENLNEDDKVKGTKLLKVLFIKIMNIKSTRHLKDELDALEAIKGIQKLDALKGYIASMFKEMNLLKDKLENKEFNFTHNSIQRTISLKDIKRKSSVSLLFMKIESIMLNDQILDLKLNGTKNVIRIHDEVIYMR